MTNSKKDKRRDDVLKRMLGTPPDPRTSKKEKSALKKEGKTQD